MANHFFYNCLVIKFLLDSSVLLNNDAIMRYNMQHSLCTNSW